MVMRPSCSSGTRERFVPRSGSREAFDLPISRRGEPLMDPRQRRVFERVLRLIGSGMRIMECGGSTPLLTGRLDGPPSRSHLPHLCSSAAKLNMATDPDRSAPIRKARHRFADTVFDSRGAAETRRRGGGEQAPEDRALCVLGASAFGRAPRFLICRAVAGRQSRSAHRPPITVLATKRHKKAREERQSRSPTRPVLFCGFCAFLWRLRP